MDPAPRPAMGFRSQARMYTLGCAPGVFVVDRAGRPRDEAAQAFAQLVGEAARLSAEWSGLDAAAGTADAVAELAAQWLTHGRDSALGHEAERFGFGLLAAEPEPLDA